MVLSLDPRKRNYARSKRITRVHFRLDRYARQLAKQVLEKKEAAEREQASTELCDHLCDLARIDIVHVHVSDKPQRHRRSQGRIVMKEYGRYLPNEKEIHITNRTAARQQILASKTFLDTLLHEWVHHYDTVKLKLNSVHTTGFYARLQHLKDQTRCFDKRR